ncbi:MAG: hypothetical protein NVV62_04340 [Terricaulis sp.]|nr:hypothetical protein [Terricaulis sp.]
MSDPEDRPAPSKTLLAHARGLAALPGEKLAELKALGAEKLQETMAAFQAALPHLRQAGFELREFEIELGVNPKLIPHFIHVAATPEDVAAARAALKENKLGASMLSVLIGAGETHAQIKVPGFHRAHMEIEVGLIPAVRLRFRADDARL